MQGATYRIISNQFAVGVSNVSKCVHDVSRAILVHMYDEYIYLPDDIDATQNMAAWKSQTEIPGTITTSRTIDNANISGIMMTIDGSHIQIKQPSSNGEVYYNRKGFYSLNVQGISFIVHCN
jgi:hypothetical protein